MFIYIALMGRRHVTFDSQCDVAAVVYGADDDPDRVFVDFANDLRRSGRRPVGVIQVGRSCRSVDPRVSVAMLPEDEMVPHIETQALGCRLDASRLNDLASRLTAAIGGGADLVIINRFGRSEAEGKGLIAVIARALDADIPVLIAVPEQRFAAWLQFSGGMNVRLACRREVLDRWWHTVTGPPRESSGPATFCEFAK
jgi:hypothetical protein